MECHGTLPNYTEDEVRKHCNEDDIWVIYDNKVYDLTSFLHRHPGGEEYIQNNAGLDVTEKISKDLPHKHSQYAFKILSGLQIGTVSKTQVKQQNSTTSLRRKQSSLHEDDLPLSSNNLEWENYGCHSWKEEDLVDWNQALLWQVGKLGPRYHEWVHTPVDRHIKLFESDFFEFFSKTPWYVIPLVWIPVLFMFMTLSMKGFQECQNDIWLASINGGIQLELWMAPFFFVLGFLGWSFVEYCLHRWLFHRPPANDSPVQITLHFFLHGQHHKTPFDRQRLVFPPVAASFFAFWLWVFYTTFMPDSIAYAQLAGVCLGYIHYDLMHYYLHHGTPYFTYLKHLKSYHVKHHFTHQEQGFGISSKIWDYPFGTLIEGDKKKM